MSGKTLTVNGQKVSTEKELKDNDHIDVAGTTILFRTKLETKA
jgi:pSer/pThr/pTyr-binding forkhead associated (FHA) protein